MPSALVVTPGGALCEQLLLAGRRRHFTTQDRLHANTWANASDDIKDAALLMATRVIDQQFTWAGFRTYPGTQRLEWPREWSAER